MFAFILAALASTGIAAPTPEPTPECVANFGADVVQIKWENDLGCDLTPPQTLTVVFDARSWAPNQAWGGDASLAWADATCVDMGGTPVWHAATWLECQTVDY